MVVKTAIVMGKLRMGKEEAEERLRASHGRIRTVLAQEGLNG
jgi:N-acetylmuramic acid 6-phosphate (MurNAc-6-P) etherase